MVGARSQALRQAIVKLALLFFGGFRAYYGRVWVLGFRETLNPKPYEGEGLGFRV